MGTRAGIPVRIFAPSARYWPKFNGNFDSAGDLTHSARRGADWRPAKHQSYLFRIIKLSLSVRIAEAACKTRLNVAFADFVQLAAEYGYSAICLRASAGGESARRAMSWRGSGTKSLAPAWSSRW
jgi:hypothetical protein